LIWFAFILSAFILYILGYNVPKTLISMEAIISCAGYSWMLNDFLNTPRKGEKYYKPLLALSITMGLLEITSGIHSIILAKSNIFTYSCLIIGAAIIYIQAKRTLK